MAVYFLLVFEMGKIGIPRGTSAIITGIVRGLPQTLQQNVATVHQQTTTVSFQTLYNSLLICHTTI
jgi:hypothetical protein